MIRIFYDVQATQGAGGNGEIPEEEFKRIADQAYLNNFYTAKGQNKGFETGYKMGASHEYRRHLSPSPGLRWVKASERLPEKCNDVIIRVIGKPVEVAVGCVADSEEEWAVDGCSWFYYDTEWLDESPSLPGEQGPKK